MPAPAAATVTEPAVGSGSDAARNVAQRLRILAAEPMLDDRQEQLRGLADALCERDQAPGWEAVPLHTAFGYPIPPDAGQGRLVARLSGARVALVFVPLFVTWAGVSWAGWLYHRELAREPELGAQSFFRLWLSGFDGAMPSFHWLAVIIAAAVLGIIGSTIVISRAEVLAEAQRARRARARSRPLPSMGYGSGARSEPVPGHPVRHGRTGRPVGRGDLGGIG